MPEANIQGSKLEAFEELVLELREEGHRALVFSQFVDHLQIVRRKLEELSIPYQYLDGSTPPAQRAESVRSFQAGSGDVFLISLRAGGSASTSRPRTTSSTWIRGGTRPWRTRRAIARIASGKHARSPSTGS
jgi:hypothetical protein